METLEAIVTQAQGLSSSPRDLAQLLDLLKAQEETLSKHAAQIDTALASLDPAVHSLAYLYFLEAHAAHAASSSSRQPNPDSSASNQTLSNQTVGALVNFIRVCDGEQVGMAPEKFASLCHTLRDLVIQRNEPARGILPLTIAVSKVQSFAGAEGFEHLTPQHADCLQLCLLGKQYRAGGRLLEGEIFQVDPKRTGVTHRDFLLHCLYGGTLLVGLKKFQKAMDLFMHAITSPAQCLSAITVSAYKRCFLVALIVNAQPPPIPKFTPSIVQRGLKAGCQDYHELATLYTSRDFTTLKQFVDAHQATFQADLNLGLARQVVASVHTRSIHRLTHTYLTLSLTHLAAAVHLPTAADAEAFLRTMIASGSMFASIDQRNGMVSFGEDPEKYDSLKMTSVIDQHIQRSTKLAKKLTLLHEQISSDRTYLTRVQVRERHVRFGEHEDYELAPQRMFDTM